MDENDRVNLEFLLNASEDTLRDWYQKIDDEDKLYAASLLELASLEFLDMCEDTDISESILRKFRL